MAKARPLIGNRRPGRWPGPSRRRQQFGKEHLTPEHGSLDVVADKHLQAQHAVEGLEELGDGGPVDLSRAEFQVAASGTVSVGEMDMTDPRPQNAHGPLQPACQESVPRVQGDAKRWLADTVDPVRKIFDGGLNAVHLVPEALHGKDHVVTFGIDRGLEEGLLVPFDGGLHQCGRGVLRIEVVFGMKGDHRGSPRVHDDDPCADPTAEADRLFQLAHAFAEVPRVEGGEVVVGGAEMDRQVHVIFAGDGLDTVDFPHSQRPGPEIESIGPDFDSLEPVFDGKLYRSPIVHLEKE